MPSSLLRCRAVAADRIVVTNDYCMRCENAIVSEEDIALIKSADRVISQLELLDHIKNLPDSEKEEARTKFPGMSEVTEDMVRELARSAAERSTEFKALAMKIMTPKRAELVRKLRCERNYTWRAIAKHCHREWEGSWFPMTNQIMGFEICSIAALSLGEDPHCLPWNDL